MRLAGEAPTFAHPDLEKHLEPGRPTWAYVDLDALVSNLEKVRDRASGRDVLAVVKADAYGLGARPVAQALREAGVGWFGVATVDEGLALRRAGIEDRILVLGGLFPPQAEAALRADLTPAVFSRDGVEALAAAARRAKSGPYPVHLKVDTGMGRLGVPMDDLDSFLAACPELAPGGVLELEGLFTHLARADEEGAEATEDCRKQLDRFAEATRRITQFRGGPPRTHISNSAASLGNLESDFDLVRPGLALFGVDPRGSETLRPVLHWCTRVLFLKDVPEGSAVGYGATWTAPEARRIATLPVGYHDGYDRRLSNTGQVLVAGRRCPVVGRVSMDMITVDVTDSPTVEEGDLAWLLEGPVSQDPPMTLEEMSSLVGCIPYEILCGISRRVPRLYLRGNQVVEIRRPS